MVAEHLRVFKACAQMRMITVAHHWNLLEVISTSIVGLMSNGK